MDFPPNINGGQLTLLDVSRKETTCPILWDSIDENLLVGDTGYFPLLGYFFFTLNYFWFINSFIFPSEIPKIYERKSSRNLCVKMTSNMHLKLSKNVG